MRHLRVLFAGDSPMTSAEAWRQISDVLSRYSLEMVYDDDNRTLYIRSLRNPEDNIGIPIEEFHDGLTGGFLRQLVKNI